MSLECIVGTRHAGRVFCPYYFQRQSLSHTLSTPYGLSLQRWESTKEIRARKLCALYLHGRSFAEKPAKHMLHEEVLKCCMLKKAWKTLTTAIILVPTQNSTKSGLPNSSYFERLKSQHPNTDEAVVYYEAKESFYKC